MAQTARARRARVRHDADLVLPEDLIMAEILVRLPAKALLRCRAVCRSWRRLTSSTNFLLAHRQHQPSLPLVEFDDQARSPWNERVDATLDALDLRRSPVERRPVLRFNDYNDNNPYRVHASCDGLLLVSIYSGRFYYICNPTTRQWIRLPNLPRCQVLGMYPHSSSGEYRILYWWNMRVGDNKTFCNVLTVGASMATRCIGEYQASEMWSGTKGPSFLLHSCLHWVRHEEGKVLVFDSVGESFRWMSAPTDDNNWTESELVPMDGTLGISRINKSRTAMKLWMLQNYEAEVWVMKYQIEFPMEEMRSIANCCGFYGIVLSENGDVLVYSPRNSYLFYCDSNGKLLQKFRCDNVFPWPQRQWFKESLVQHAFFKRKNGRHKRTPQFFRGL